MRDPGRGVDDLQDLSGVSLLFERFVGFYDQPRVLYGDDRLVSEGAHQFSLRLVKRLDSLAR